MSRATLTAPPARHDVVLTREFDAPRQLVFDVYTDPQTIPRWWGPRSLTTTVDQMDVRPGGTWRFVQRDAAGNEFAFRGVYHEIVPPERIVQTFEFEGMPGHVVLETAVFEDLGGRTRLTTTSVFQTVEDRDAMVATGMEEGAVDSMERIAELLAGRAGALQPFDALVGEWEMESPLLPGTRGRDSFRRIEGGAYLLWTSEAPDPIPDSTCVIGSDDSGGPLTMLYHDSRGVSRVYRTTFEDGVWNVWREAPGFWQRFTGSMEGDGRTIRGAWEASEDGTDWKHDFDLAFHRID
jgi:uncharacterized protein YndB with AHSA1/START domain